jgi:FMN-dependent NADH-azoreductase
VKFEMKKILYVNACITREVDSRTDRLAQAYLKKTLEVQDCILSTVKLEDTVMYPLSGKILTEREKAIADNDFSSALFDLARNFAAADEVVIAAPYWDMSFPASLKLYMEQLCVNKLTFCYNEKGMPCGLTNVKKVVYLTTAGGYIGNNNFGFDYIKGVFSTLFGVADISFFSAEGLDIFGNDPEKIVSDAIDKMYNSVS